MRESEDQCSTNRHSAICDQPEGIVNNGRAEHEEQHADPAPRDYAFDAMSTKAERKSHDADRQYHEQHLHVKMPFAELTHERNERDEDRQGEAMKQAQTRQCDRHVVEKT